MKFQLFRHNIKVYYLSLSPKNPLPSRLVNRRWAVRCQICSTLSIVNGDRQFRLGAYRFARCCRSIWCVLRQKYCRLFTCKACTCRYIYSVQVQYSTVHVIAALQVRENICLKTSYRARETINIYERQCRANLQAILIIKLQHYCASNISHIETNAVTKWKFKLSGNDY